MKECVIVVHRNYAETLDAHAFFSEENARRSMMEAVEGIIDMLQEEGYAPKFSDNGWDNVEVSAAGGDIYYEWNIIISEIQ